MGKKENIIIGLKKFKRNISTEITVDNFVFFGSRVRGDFHKDSDIDLLIVSKDFKHIKSFKRAIKLYDHWKLDYPVDFLCLTPEEFKLKQKQIGIIHDAVKEGIIC